MDTKKILIVEDEETLAKVLEEKFKKEKFKVEVAYDGEAAMLAAKRFKPDLILLDLILPGKHGLEVLKELKADAELKTAPVIVLSNIDSDESIKQALALGAVDYFVKTQHALNEVMEKIKNQLIKGK
ncbi:response regulator [Candidatus Uhrbacteria bacterium]|nr:response regulator [Candidatus Uhrbacteria bacterium]